MKDIVNKSVIFFAWRFQISYADVGDKSSQRGIAYNGRHWRHPHAGKNIMYTCSTLFSDTLIMSEPQKSEKSPIMTNRLFNEL